MPRLHRKGDDTLAYYDSIYYDQELNHRAKAVYIYLKDHANKAGTCWPGINTIAAEEAGAGRFGESRTGGEVQPLAGKREPYLQPLSNHMIPFRNSPIYCLQPS